MMYWDDHGMNGWGAGLMVFTTLLFLGLLVAAAVVLFRYAGRSAQQHPAPRPPEQRSGPEQVLAERLARGEIDPEEYRLRLAALRDAAGRGGDGAGWTP
ncbi:SHOCT domain-containing protein [Kitasatospora phosalacinea]|uniref:SHOCT domain-containing protein n=1 Tax=Kitasatospora phosalacinea TaxID=2065 RepID=A0ABW6GG80_9ACTN